MLAAVPVSLPLGRSARRLPQAYPVTQAYDSLALEDNSEVGEAVPGRCSISWVDISAF